MDETKGLSSNSDYESEYATPPPETRSTDITSVFSTPAADIHALPEPDHVSILPASMITHHGTVHHSQSPTAIASSTSPFTHALWEEQVVSSTPQPSHEALPLLSSSNPLTIEGILNKSGTEPLRQEVYQAYDHGERSPSIPPIYSERPIWPLADPAEALLLRHFVQNLAIWVRIYKTFSYCLLIYRTDLCLSLTCVIPNSTSRSMSREGPGHVEFC